MRLDTTFQPDSTYRFAPRPKTARPRYVGVQYARAFAAIGVLLFHAAQRVGVDFAAGARGVDVFFVISGFIMWSISATSAPSPGGFLVNRARRIVPLYWLATLVVIAAALVGLLPRLASELTDAHIVQSLFFIPHVAPGSGQIWPVLTPGWTLNLEMFFYVVFAAFLVLPRRRRLIALTSTFVALVVMGALFPPTAAVLKTYTSPLILEFVAGVWLAEAVRRQAVLSLPLAALAIAGGVAGLALIPFSHPLAQALSCAVAASAVVAGVVAFDVRRRTPSAPPLALLGDASYSIYLWHGLAVSVAAALGAKLGLTPVLTIGLGLAGGVVAGLLSYRIVEKPIEAFLAKNRRTPPNFTALSA